MNAVGIDISKGKSTVATSSPKRNSFARFMNLTSTVPISAFVAPGCLVSFQYSMVPNFVEDMVLR
jgi:hypothetical protein